ncbi:tyrosine-type recombinase/integrase [Zobellia sp. B3R18]|uniref:tyrosine-type recombinase/integrase n=1 Tax=Zobellia sp. B3R18 TaxID=2841568 RepID=UPI001C07DFEF|nr:phage integrase SAM-like domain-containing protein [Zobellia sp. B3R18]MBU2974992.1 phage integrase SAM-like domain-containing protein [Zobellia sp. B3R18]
MSKYINSTAGSVRFILKEPNSDKITPIIFDFSFGRGKRLKCATGFKIHPKFWDSKNQRIRAVSTISNREEVNAKLRDIETSFIKSVSFHHNQGNDIDRKFLKQIFSNLTNRIENESEDKSIDFFEYADGFTEDKQRHIDKTKTITLSKITLRAYKQTIKKLKAYSKSYDPNLDFDSINLEFYYSFIHYLENEGLSLNTIGKHLKNLIAILNRATEEGINTNLAFQHREFRRVSENTTSIYLTTHEIEKLEKKDLSDKPLHEKARDIFLIGYYTGQRVSDYNGLGINNIRTFEGRSVFEIVQQKTSKTVYIPIHPKLTTIFKKRYKGKMPSKMPEQLINKYIKEVARSVKINEDVFVTRTIGGKKNTDSIKKYKLIGTHTARRSFCTNAYLSKMPVIDIMAISGHTTEKEFYKYIKVSSQERAIKIADSAFFQ